MKASENFTQAPINRFSDFRVGFHTHMGNVEETHS